MKISRLILVTLFISAYATITVVHINMAQPKPVAEATLDMIEIMTRAFDESEGGEGGHTVKNDCAQCMLGEACEDYWVPISEPRPGPLWEIKLNCEVSCKVGMWMSPLLKVESNCFYVVDPA